MARNRRGKRRGRDTNSKNKTETSSQHYYTKIQATVKFRRCDQIGGRKQASEGRNRKARGYNQQQQERNIITTLQNSLQTTV